MNFHQDIFSWIKSEELAFGQDVEITDNWYWNFKKHINWTILFKHGKFPVSENNFTRPNKNIILPILNVQYRAEDIDLRDVNLYVDEPENDHLSLLVKAYHDEVYAPQHKLNTFFDEIKEEKIDFGGVIVRQGAEGALFESLETLAFCDKTDFLTGAICFKSEYTPEELYEKQKIGWGKKGADITIDQLIDLFETANLGAKAAGVAAKDKIEVYRVHGSLPSNWLDENIKDRYTRQLQVVAFFQNAEGKATGVTLYKSKELENPFKVHLRGKKIKNRALAFGGVEELFDPQIWTNFAEITKHNFLKAASKILLWSDDETFAAKNNIDSQENLEINLIEQGKQIGQVPTTPVSLNLFAEWANEMQTHAQRLGSASPLQLSQPAPAQTPFRAQQLQVIESNETHEYRKDKFKDFVQELYEDWFIPDMKNELLQGKKFLASLSAEQLEYVANCMAKNIVAKEEKQKVLDGRFGEILTQDERDAKVQETIQQIKGKGNKWFIEILKGGFEDKSLKVRVDIGKRNKEFADAANKMIGMLQSIFANPSILDNPKLMKIFTKVWQFYGLDPLDLQTIGYQKPAQPQMQPQQPQQLSQQMPQQMPQVNQMQPA